MLVRPEREGERIEHTLRAEPDVARPAFLEARSEPLLERLSYEAPNTVGSHDQVETVQLGHIRDLMLELELYADLSRAVREDLEQSFPSYAGEDLAPAPDHLIPVTHVDRIPDDEVVRDAGVGVKVGLAERRERSVGEDDPPSVGRSGGVPLEHADVVLRRGLLQEQREVETPRPGPHNAYLHLTPPSARLEDGRPVRDRARPVAEPAHRTPLRRIRARTARPLAASRACPPRSSTRTGR